MQYLWFFIFLTAFIGIVSRFIIGHIYKSMILQDSKSPLVKQIRLKYENCKKLNISINNVQAFVEKSLESYRILRLSLNSFDNISKEMAYLCAALGIANAYLYKDNLSDVFLSLEISAICVLALHLINVIVDTPNLKHNVIIGLIDELENTGPRDHIKEESTLPDAPPVPEPVPAPYVSREASLEFSKLDKTLERIDFPAPKLPIDNRILEEILEEFLT